MAVVRMKKMFLLGPQSQRDDILHDIAFAGSVELTDPSVVLTGEEGLSDFVQRQEADSRLSAIEAKIDVLRQGIAILAPLAPSKKKLFAPKDSRSRAEFEDMRDRADDAVAVSNKAIYRREQIAALQNLLTAKEMARSALLPWQNFDLPLGFEGTKSTQTVLFIAPAGFDRERFNYDISSLGAVVEQVSEDKNQSYFAAIVHRADGEDFAAALKAVNCTAVTLSGDAASKELDKADAEIAECRANIQALKEGFAELAEQTDMLKFCFDALSAEYKTLEARERLLATDSVFLANGYVPASEAERIEKALSAYTVCLEFSDPDPEKDDVPVKLKNNSLVEPYEMVTEMYDLPKYGQLDPDAVMAPFFWLIAGMMYADLGYGIVLTLVGFLLHYVAKVKGTFGKISGLMFQCGISTMIFGALYGSFFGDAVTQGAKVFFGLEGVKLPALFDPMGDPLTLMIICIGVGLVHIMAGMGVQAYQLVKDGHPFAALFDVGSWYVVFIGVVVLVLGGNWGLYMMIAGAAMLVLTQGREKKGIFGKLIGGLGSLYGVTSYLSDLLSYSRILALCLSGAVVAQVFNSIGSLLGHTVPGMILFAIMFVIGHTFNIAMNLLGTYVHTSRLQYIEFFGKFYRSGGKPFTPVRVTPKYVDYKEET